MAFASSWGLIIVLHAYFHTWWLSASAIYPFGCVVQVQCDNHATVFFKKKGEKKTVVTVTAFPYLCNTNVLSVHFKFQSTHPAAEGNSPGLWVLMKALLKCCSECRRRKTKKRPFVLRSRSTTTAPLIVSSPRCGCHDTHCHAHGCRATFTV